MVQFLRIFFRWFSLILPALFQLLPHRVLDRLLWVRARLFVQAVRSPFGFFSTKFFRKFRDLLQVNRVPSDYSWEWHTQESVVYVRTKHVGPGSATQFYIGSTADTVHRRELSRRRKYLQLCRDRIAYFEPALKVWAFQGDFYCGIGIVLRQVSDTVDRLAWEAKYIRDFQPPLNAPWVGQLLRKHRLHERRFVLPSPGTGRRFVTRARRHARYRFSAYSHCVESNDVFLSMYKLGSNSKLKFLEAKLLRSRSTDLTHLYLRSRLLKFVSEPWKTRATNQLRLTLKFRQGHPPPVNRPLVLAPLSHDLRQQGRILLRRLICQERCNFPPLHLPRPSWFIAKVHNLLCRSSTTGVSYDIGPARRHQFVPVAGWQQNIRLQSWLVDMFLLQLDPLPRTQLCQVPTCQTLCISAKTGGYI